MYNQVIFYNHFGAGDIFESREFVKAWMKLVPSNSYHYSHGKNPRILLDIPKLEYKEVTVHMDGKKSVWDDGHGNLYVNTWIGRNGGYVLPGIGCTVEKLYQMYNDMLGVYNLGQLPGQPIDYIPSIDYTKYETKNIEQFFIDTDGLQRIYIDNGLVQSNQAKNFAFNPIIETLANKYRQTIFVCTQNYDTNFPNVYFVGNMVPGLGFDLNEASYVSLGCNILVGRNSGPHVFTQVKENVMREDKKLLSFTYHHQGSSFVVNTDVAIHKLWSPVTSFNDVVEVMEEVIG